MYILRERVLGFGEDAEITDDDGRPVLYIDQKLLSLRDRLIVRDPAGRELAQVSRKMVSLRPTYEIVIGDGISAEVTRRFFTPFGERFTIDIPGPDDMEIVGDLADHEFQVKRNGQIVATVSRRWASLQHSYAVEIGPGENDLLILASLLAADLAADGERERQGR